MKRAPQRQTDPATAQGFGKALQQAFPPDPAADGAVDRLIQLLDDVWPAQAKEPKP